MSPGRVARKYFPGAEGDSLVGFNGRDLRAPTRMALRIVNAKPITSAGTVAMLTNPLPGFSQSGTMADDFARHARSAVSYRCVAKIFGRQQSSAELRITLPEGWKAQSSAERESVERVRTYEATYAQNGRELVISRKLTGGTGAFLPARGTGAAQLAARDRTRRLEVHRAGQAVDCASEQLGDQRRRAKRAHRARDLVEQLAREVADGSNACAQARFRRHRAEHSPCRGRSKAPCRAR